MLHTRSISDSELHTKTRPPMSKPLIKSITKRQAMIFAGFLVMYEFLTYMANDMIMPGMLQVVKSFNAPETTVATSLTIYMLGGASLQLILGPISDSYGRRSIMLIGACLFVLFTLWIACSNSMSQFLIARFFQGMGLCFIGVIGYAVIQEIFEEMDAIRIISIMANAAILAPLLGPVIGAVFIYYTSWRYIFVCIALLGVVAFLGLLRYMPESLGQRKRDGTYLHKAPFCPRLIAQNYSKLLRNATFCFGTLAISVLGIPCIAWIALSPIILITEAKLSVIQYGLWQIPIFGASIIGNAVLHRLTHQYEIKPIIYIGTVVLIISMVLLYALPYFLGNYYLYLIPGIIVYFSSISIIHAPLSRYCLFITSVSKGTATAVVSLAVMGIGAAGIEVANYFYSAHNNLNFSLCCVLMASLYLLFIFLAFRFDKSLKVTPVH